MRRTQAGYFCLLLCSPLFLGTVSTARAGSTLITEEEAKLPPPKEKAPSRGIMRAPRIELAEFDKGQLHSPVRLELSFKPYGGASIDLTTLRVTYLRTPNVDLTPRIKPFCQSSGIDMPDAELPPGDHLVRVDIEDSDGRPASKSFVLSVVP